MNKLRRLNQAGDTIVEVLLAVVIVGIAIGLGYGVASRSLKANRQAQERVEAVKVAENQVERLKKLSTTDNGGGIFNGGTFCIADIEGQANAIVPEGDVPASLADTNLDTDYEDPCITDIYHTAIIPSSDIDNQFNVTVRWYGLGGQDKEEVVIGYRAYPPKN